MGFFSDLFDTLFGWLVPSQPKQKREGLELTKAATNAYVPVLYGTLGKVKGTIIFQRTNDIDNDDTKNDLLHLIIVWGMGAVQTIDQIYLDDIPITDSKFDAEGGNRWAYARHFNNGMANVAYNDPTLNAAGWNPTTDRLDGIACSYIRLEWNSSNPVFNGVPDIRADITGQLVNDISNGGVLSSSNPVDQLYHYLTECPVGKNLPASDIDLASFQAARDICETQVETEAGSGVFQPLFTSNIALDTGNSVLDNVNIFLRSMRAWLPIDSDGKLKLIIEKDDPVTTEVLDDQNIIAVREVTNSSKDKRFNRVAVRYIEPTANHTQQEAVWPEKNSQTETDFLAEDNGIVLEKSVTLENCQDYYEALRFAQTLCRVSREQLRAKITADPIAQQFEVGDIVPVTYAKMGWNAKPFRVENKVESVDGQVSLVVREHQPAIFDWDNTGTKPTFEDTDLDFSNPTKPTEVTFTPYYDGLKQGVVSWTSTHTRFAYYIWNENYRTVQSGEIGRKSLDINNLPLGNYTIGLQTRQSFNRSSNWALQTFTIALPQTQGGATIDTNAGETVITPPLPFTNQTYEWKVNTVDDINTATDRGQADSLLIVTEHNQTYFVWYRLVSPVGVAGWVQVAFTGVGLSSLMLDEDLSSTIARADVGGAIDQSINQVSSDLITQNQNTQIELQANALETINAISQYSQNTLDLIDELSALEGIVVTLDEELGLLQVEGGAVTATQFNAVQVTVNAQTATISTLAATQTTQQQTINYHASQLIQQAESITLLQESIGDGDFTTLGLRLNGIDNSISQSAISAQITNLNLINEIVTGAGTTRQLIEEAEKLAIAETKIQALTDDQGATAQQLTTIGTTANDGYAIAQQLTKSVSNANAQFAASIDILRAQQGENYAEFKEVTEVLVDGQGNAKAVWTALLDVNGRITGFELLNTGTQTSAAFRADKFAILDTEGKTVFLLNTETNRLELDADIILGDGKKIQTVADIKAEETITGELSNSVHTIAADEGGTLIGSLNDAGGTFTLTRGESNVPTNEINFILVSATGLSANINTSGVYSITSLTSDTATATFRATVGAVSIDRVYTITKQRQGATGATGQQGQAGVDGQDGINGIDGAYYTFIYKVTASAPPATPAGGSFNGTLETIPAGWTDDPTYSGTGIEWISRARYTQDQNGNWTRTTDWSAPSIYAQAGEDGANGANGQDGVDGSRGAGWYAINTPTGAWVDATANTAVPDGIPVEGDVVTISKAGDPTVSTSKRYESGAWVVITEIIHGSLLVTDSVTAKELVAGSRIITPEINTDENGAGDTSKDWSVLADGTFIQRLGDKRLIMGKQAGANDEFLFWYGQSGLGKPSRTLSNAIVAIKSDGQAKWGGETLAENVTGDFTASIQKTVSLSWLGAWDQKTACTVTVSAAPFIRFLTLDPFHFEEGSINSYNVAVYNQSGNVVVSDNTVSTLNSGAPPISRKLSWTLAANTTHTFTIKIKPQNLGTGGVNTPAFISAFKSGSTLS